MLGEGAWMLVLEREDRARARGERRVYASIDGYASTCDAYHRVADGSGRGRDRPGDDAGGGAVRKKAREQIGYVNLHGTSTQMNDAVEARQVREVFPALTPITSRDRRSSR